MSQIVLILFASLTAAAGADPDPLRVLVFSGQNNHNWRETTPVISDVLARSGRFKVDVTERPDACTPAVLADYDVILSNWNTYGRNITVKDWPETARQAVLGFVTSGKGFVVVHAGGSCFSDWKEFQTLIGATWGKGTGHGPVHEFAVKVTAADHPVMRGLKDFRIRDELWHRMAAQPDKQVLATAFSDAKRGGSGQDEPVVMTTQYGEGRCFNLVLGHDTRTMENPSWRTLLLRGTEWAATGNVTGPSDETETRLKAAGAYVHGQSRAPLQNVEKLVFEAGGKPVKQKALAEKLCTALASDATVDSKAFFCDQLSLVGSAEHVPALTALLSNTNLATAARSALERIPGPACDAAIREALAGSDGLAAVGLAHTLGVRRDAGAVDALKACLAGKGDEVTGAAAYALGLIRTPAALDALLGVVDGALSPATRNALDDAILQCVQTQPAGTAGQAKCLAALNRLSAPEKPAHIRMAAFSGLLVHEPDAATQRLRAALTGSDRALLLAAIRGAEKMPGEQLVAALGGSLAGFPEDVRIQLIALLGKNGSPAAIPLLQDLLKAAPTVQEATISALTRIGGALAVDALLSSPAAAERSQQKRIGAALTQMAGANVDTALLRYLASEDVNTLCLVSAVLAERKAVASVPHLVQLTGHSEDRVRREAYKALGSLGDATVCTELIGRLDGPSAAADTRSVVLALGRICKRDPNGLDALLKAYESATHQQKEGLLTVLGHTGGPAALGVVKAASSGDNPELRTAAVRAMAGWADAAPLNDLLSVARNVNDDATRSLALRGVAALLPKADTLTPPQKLSALNQALAAARLPGDRNVLLKELTTIGSLEALKLAHSHLGSAGSGDEAALAVSTIAAHVWSAHPNEVRSMLRELLNSTNVDLARTQALETLVLLDKPRNLAIDSKASSPDGLDADGASGGDADAIDGKLVTYWDEVDRKSLYRLRLDFTNAVEVASIRITGFLHHNYAPRDFDILCDDKVVKTVKDATYTENTLVVAFKPVVCSALELKITGSHGPSPAIRELEVFGTPFASTANSQHSNPTANGER